MRATPKSTKDTHQRDLRSWSETRHPFERVHIDIAYHNEKNMLVLYDSFLSWGNVHIIQTLASNDIIQALPSTSSMCSFLKCLFSDNVPCFLSSEFRTLCTFKKTEHVVTSPYHKQSNGAAEKFIDSLKIFIRKNTSAQIPFNLMTNNFSIRHNDTNINIAKSSNIRSFGIPSENPVNGYSSKITLVCSGKKERDSIIWKQHQRTAKRYTGALKPGHTTSGQHNVIFIIHCNCNHNFWRCNNINICTEVVGDRHATVPVTEENEMTPSSETHPVVRSCRTKQPEMSYGMDTNS